MRLKKPTPPDLMTVTYRIVKKNGKFAAQYRKNGLFRWLRRWRYLSTYAAKDGWHLTCQVTAEGPSDAAWFTDEEAARDFVRSVERKTIAYAQRQGYGRLPRQEEIGVTEL